MRNILAYTAEQQNSSVLLNCCDGRQITTDKWEELSGFLLQPCEFAVVYQIDNFFNIISQTLPSKIVKELQEGKSGRAYTEDGRKLYYKVGRKFGINQIDFYGLKHYIEEEITDAKELEKLAHEVIDAFGYFGIVPKKLTSPVAVYEEVLSRVDFPVASDLPEEAMGMIQQCDKKRWEEWREIFKLGHWKQNEIIDLDISCAYPSIIAKLPDIRNVKYFESDVMPDADEFDWGEMEGLLTINKDVTFFKKIGTWQDCITTAQKRLIDKYEWGDFKFMHGWFLKLPQRYSFPFKKTMQTLYEARYNQSTMVSRIAKAISVGIGGKFAQKFDSGELGDFYNSIYSRIITSQCSNRVADFIYRNGISKSVISIMVDGVLIENDKIKLDLGDGGMGSWRMNEPSPFLVASLLYQWGGTKQPNGEYYSDIIKHIQDSPKSPIIGKDIDLNLLTYEKFFQNRPKCGRDLLDNKYKSKPIIKGDIK